MQVDAVVTKDGKPVSNLTAEDFEIFEDGKKQTITNFAYISNVPNSAPPPPTKPADKKPEVVPFTPITPDQPHRTVAFVVDDLGLSAESMSQVRRQLRKFVAEQLQPNDLVAIIRTSGEMGALQQFTNDKRLLNRAADQLRWNVCNRVGVSVLQAVGSAGPSLCGRRTIVTTLKSLRFIIDAMGYLPGRKSMVFMSDHLPREDQDEFSLGQSRLNAEGIFKDDADNSGIPQIDVGKGKNGLSNNGLDSINYADALQKIAEMAIRSSVVIYSVDTQGLQVTGLTAADNFRGSGQQFQELLSFRSHLLWARREGGDLIARQTGGFQIRNSNNFGLERIMQDQAGYYLIGYRPTEETFNRRFHHIKAKVKRSGMTLRTRFGFFGVTEEEANSRRTRLTPGDQTNLALVSPFGPQDIEVDLTAFFSEEEATGPMVRSFLYLGAKDLEFTKENGENKSSIELHSVIFGDNGAVVDQLKRGATISLSDSEYEYAKTNGFGVGINMPVKRPGAYQFRVVVRDRKSSKIGSAGQFVTVPNLKDKKLAVSGIVLGTVDQLTNQGIANQEIVNPGSRRFERNSDLYFAYRIYNAAADGGAQLRNMVMETKLFRDGKNVYSGPEVAINAGNQKDLDRVFVDGVVRLSSELEPGNYYLQILVTEKGAKNRRALVVQWVDFEIVSDMPLKSVQ